MNITCSVRPAAANRDLEPGEYRIKSVTDFFSVPAARRDLCLSEFAVWLTLMEHLQRDANELNAALGQAVSAPDLGEFIWIDDDKGEARIVLTPVESIEAKGSL